MGIKIDKEKTYTKAIIDENCNYDKFYQIVDLLKKDFKIDFINELDGLDSLYWDFVYKNSNLTIHYNIYTGISIFPIAINKATSIDNQNVIEIGELIWQKLKT